MFEHLRKIPAKDKIILRFGEVSNAWRSKITGYFSEERRTSEQADNRNVLGGIFRRRQNCQKILRIRKSSERQNFSFRKFNWTRLVYAIIANAGRTKLTGLFSKRAG